MFKAPYSSDTMKILGRGHLAAGAPFVRCPAVDAAAAIKAASEINEDGAFLAWHPDHGDYLRINRGTAAFRIICALRS